MAKYTVNYSCGHTATIDLWGKVADRERKIKWLEQSGSCPECFKAQKAAEKAEAEKKEEEKWNKIACLYPVIEGVSDKQTAYADDLRRKVLLGERGEKFAFDRLLAMPEAAYKAEVEKMSAAYGKLPQEEANRHKYCQLFWLKSAREIIDLCK